MKQPSDLEGFENHLREAGVSEIVRDIHLAEISRWKIGGPADLLVTPRTTEEVAITLRALNGTGIPLFVLGDGSNMLMDSRGFRGVVMKIGQSMGAISIKGTKVTCGAGTWVPFLAMRLARAGLGGLEHVVGIPGTLGGLVLMNGGSQRKGVGSNVVMVTCVTKDGETHTMTRDELVFGYRQSALQGSGAVITEVVLELEPCPASEVRKAMIDIMKSRRQKFPKNLPNCGSTFLSNPAMYETIGPPGKVIEEAGFKGVTIGKAQVSPLHANFIVNRGGATSDEVLALIAAIRGNVFKRTGYKLDCEARHITEFGEERPAHEFTDSGRFDLSLLEHMSPPLPN